MVRSLVLLLCAGSLIAGELRQETLAAWDAYVAAAESRTLEPVAAGETVAAPTEKRIPKPVPHGLIHDWIGATFIPGAKLSEVLEVVQDYDRYKEFYQPSAVESRLMARDGGRYSFSLTLVNKAVLLKTGLETQGDATYTRVDASHWTCAVRTTRIREIVNMGQADERRLPPDQGSGFIWRLESFSRIEERDGGVYVELEAIALTRDVPAALRWFVNPLVRNLSRGALATSLRQTTAAVQAKMQHRL